MINKQQLAALIKAVEEGGDDDDEITEDEAIAILRDTGLDAEIPSVREWFACSRWVVNPYASLSKYSLLEFQISSLESADHCDHESIMGFIGIGTLVGFS
jgi:hypothetical protein